LGFVGRLLTGYNQLQLSSTMHMPKSNSYGLSEIVRRIAPFLRGEWRLVGSIVVFGIVTSLLSLAIPVAVQALVNTVAFGNLTQQLFVLSGILFLVLSFSALLKLAQIVAAEHLQRRLFVRLLLDIAERIPKFFAHGIRGIFGAEVVNPFLEVAILQKSMAYLFVSGVGLLLQIFFGLLLLAFYHPLLLAFSLILGLLVLAIFFIMGPSGIPTADAESSAKYKALEWLEDLAHSPTVFRSAEGMKYAVETADNTALEWLNTRRSHFKVLLSQNIATYTTHAIASAVLLVLGGYLVISGQLTLGQLVAAELVVNAALTGLIKFGSHLESLYDLSGAAGKLNKLRDIQLENLGGDKPSWKVGEPAALSIRDVSLRLERSTRPILDRLSLDVKPGDRIAILGENGVGKSLLTDAIFGFLSPDEGVIEIDGHNIKDLCLSSLRSRVSVVTTPRFFSGTLEDNFRIGKDVSRIELRGLLDKLGLSQKLSGLENGLQTYVSPSHRIFSYGELLRMSIAQAIITKPGLIIFDQTFDGVDERSLEAVLEVVKSRAPASSIIMLTHNPVIADHFPTKYILHMGKLSRDKGSSRSAGTKELV
jgi:putative ABC transport system ATP-binding protein